VADAFAKQVDLATSMIVRLLEREEPDRAARTAGALASVRDAKMKQSVFATKIHTLVDDLEADLLQMIGDCCDSDSARCVARLLQARGSSYTAALREQLQRADANRLCRYLSVFEMIEPAPGGEFLFVLVDANARTRGELTAVLTRLQNANATSFLSDALASSDARVVTTALACMTELGDTDLIDQVSDLVSESQDEHVLKAACKWLGATGDARAVAALAQLLSRGKRMFGLIAGVPDSSRLAAVRALAKLRMPEAREALFDARKDASAAIREAVVFALRESR
jgi:hypothetical protein